MCVCLNAKSHKLSTVENNTAKNDNECKKQKILQAKKFWSQASQRYKVEWNLFSR